MYIYIFNYIYMLSYHEMFSTTSVHEQGYGAPWFSRPMAHTLAAAEAPSPGAKRRPILGSASALKNVENKAVGNMKFCDSQWKSKTCSQPPSSNVYLGMHTCDSKPHYIKL